MESLVNALTHILKRTVIDKTGFSGNFDVTIRWRDEAAAANPGAAATDALPSIFTALEEQLGLKLESSKGPVAVLVIDSAERPQPN
jgi:uncharacterized protein (TIGR03435 family)